MANCFQHISLMPLIVKASIAQSDVNAESLNWMVHVPVFNVKGLWCGILHHVVNEHSWLLPFSDTGDNKCSHGPLTEDVNSSKWLQKGSPAHEALRSIVLNKRFLNQVVYYLNFRSTAELENFHQLILMYAAKRFAYSPPVYRARNLLAAIDYNANVDRDVQKNKDGTIRYHRQYNKKSGRWVVVPYKVTKCYQYMAGLLAQCLERRLRDKGGMRHKREMRPDDPRRISKTLAALPPPPTRELVAMKKSRKTPFHP